jgi:hypothetical protein
LEAVAELIQQTNALLDRVQLFENFSTVDAQRVEQM